jgi:hypothetical protein
MRHHVLVERRLALQPQQGLAQLRDAAHFQVVERTAADAAERGLLAQHRGNAGQPGIDQLGGRLGIGIEHRIGGIGRGAELAHRHHHVGLRVIVPAFQRHDHPLESRLPQRLAPLRGLQRHGEIHEPAQVGDVLATRAARRITGQQRRLRPERQHFRATLAHALEDHVAVVLHHVEMRPGVLLAIGLDAHQEHVRARRQDERQEIPVRHHDATRGESRVQAHRQSRRLELEEGLQRPGIASFAQRTVATDPRPVVLGTLGQRVGAGAMGQEKLQIPVGRFLCSRSHVSRWFL